MSSVPASVLAPAPEYEPAPLTGTWQWGPHLSGLWRKVLSTLWWCWTLALSGWRAFSTSTGWWRTYLEMRWDVLTIGLLFYPSLRCPWVMRSMSMCHLSTLKSVQTVPWLTMGMQEVPSSLWSTSSQAELPWLKDRTAATQGWQQGSGTRLPWQSSTTSPALWRGTSSTLSTARPPTHCCAGSHAALGLPSLSQ